MFEKSDFSIHFSGKLHTSAFISGIIPFYWAAIMTLLSNELLRNLKRVVIKNHSNIEGLEGLLISCSNPLHPFHYIELALILLRHGTR